MTTIQIDQPHGYLKDTDDRVVIRFANWEVDRHEVPDAVAVVEYVDGPNAHDESVHDRYKSDL